MLSRSMWSCSFLLILVFVAQAQRSSSTGEVEGTILCADTGLPARYASVTVESAARGGRWSGKSDGDGHFRIDGVAAGNVLVYGSYPGYISSVHATSSASSVDSGIQNATVVANQDTQVTVFLVRGGVVTGVVRYQDGAPAPAIPILAFAVISGPAGVSQTQAAATNSMDDGAFRLSGLAPGRITLVATVPGQSKCKWFLGDTSNSGKAKILSIGKEELIEGVTLTLPGTEIMCPADTPNSSASN